MSAVGPDLTHEAAQRTGETRLGQLTNSLALESDFLSHRLFH
jgi:hypothetical protein